MHDVTAMLPGATTQSLMLSRRLISNTGNAADSHQVHAMQVSCPHTGLL